MMNLLLEIGTEEIPAKFMPAALLQLAEVAQTKFTELGIPFKNIKTAGTPRRLTLFITGLAAKQNDKNTATKGPAVKIAFDAQGEPTKVALGFAKKHGLAAEDLTQQDGYVYAVVKEAGQAVEKLLPAILPDLINSLTFPKTMRWGGLDWRFVRPVRSLVALLGKKVIPFTLAGVMSGKVTSGHRFLG
ncbi:MAG: glycine--tRNA ligase subunit beta, partial [Sporomusaceae bacterium]|nr:glycine--tRNA ligase subunit beta [Sporomusaceae bacterium]